MKILSKSQVKFGHEINGYVDELVQLFDQFIFRYNNCAFENKRKDGR